MGTVRELEKKIENETYTLKEIEDSLLIENKYFLFSVMLEIARRKIISDTIIQHLKDLASGHKEISNQGFGNFTVRVTALATLVKLDYTDDYNLSGEQDKKWVDATLNDKMWKEI